MAKGPKPRTAAERFWPKVQGASAEECWLWLGAKTPDGYGRFYISPGRYQAAHRFAYEQLVAEIPAGLELDHLCRQPSCVNPWHVDPVTTAVNSERRPHGQSQKTHCPAGHPYSPENTHVRAKGRGRRCRTCHNSNSTSPGSAPAKPATAPAA